MAATYLFLYIANTQTVATVLYRREYEKKYSHTKIKIKNNKEKMCDIDNKKLVIYDNNNFKIYSYIHTKIYTGLE